MLNFEKLYSPKLFGTYQSVLSITMIIYAAFRHEFTQPLSLRQALTQG